MPSFSTAADLLARVAKNLRDELLENNQRNLEELVLEMKDLFDAKTPKVGVTVSTNHSPAFFLGAPGQVGYSSPVSHPPPAAKVSPPTSQPGSPKHGRFF